MIKVLVIGGGFAGSFIAKRLEANFDVTLIDNKSYFEFTPGILRNVVKKDNSNRIRVLHKSYLKNTKLIIGNVTEISNNYVKVNGKKLNFDYLAICLGTTFRALDKSFIVASNAGDLEKYHDKLSHSKKILIVGGGLVGVELAAEICTHYDKEITLVHAASGLIERNPLKASKYVEDFLIKHNVNVIYSEKIIGFEKGVYVTDKGTRITSDLAFLCTGVKSNYSPLQKNLSHVLNENKYVSVNNHLQIIGHNNIFAAGDISAMPIEKTAQVAKKQAEVVVKNIIAISKNKKLISYFPKTGPMIISLGKFDSVLVYKNLVFTGLIPAFMKHFVQFKEINSLKKKV